MDYNDEPKEVTTINVEVEFTQVLSCKRKINTKDYTIVKDEDSCTGSYIDFDTSGFADTIEKQWYTIEELLKTLRCFLERDNDMPKWMRDKLIESCKGWEIEETTIQDYREL